MGAVDWDLQAVVRGCCLTAADKVAVAEEDQISTKEESVVDGEDRNWTDFPDITATRTAVHELQELLKPFFPNLQRHQLPSALQSCTSSSSSPSCPVVIPPLLGAHQPQRSVQSNRQHQLSPMASSSKRRKNQQKRVVCQVSADGASPDMWAWRKYGQKPIKGSPFPRGYYRCSSSKGCMARKQVERSRIDPTVLIITYTAEHNHPVPTHRNSLAGSTRPRFHPPPTAAASSSNDGAGKPSTSPVSPTTCGGLSPTTPLTVSMEDLQKGEEDGEEDGGELEGEEEDDLLLVDNMHCDNDYLFTKLEGFSCTSSMTTMTAGTTDAVSVTTTLLKDDDCLGKHRFAPTWMTSQ